MTSLHLAELIRDVWPFLPDAQRRRILELLVAQQTDDQAILAAITEWANESHN